MLTSFFGKSAPINYLMLTIVVVLGYLAVWQLGYMEPQAEISWWYHLIGLFCIVFSILLVDFIIRKNSLTELNNFGILIFTFLLLAIPALVWNVRIVGASVLCLLAFRRTVSLPSLKNIEKKLLDASLWIGLAAYLYPYALVFIIMIYVALILIGKVNIRFLLIPILGLISTLTILTAAQLLLFDSFDWLSNFSWSISLDFSAYNRIELLIMVSVLLGLIIWLITFRLIHYKRIMRKQRPVYLLVKVFLVLSLLVSVASENRNGSELIFIFAPFSMALADYVENRERTLVKEVILWFFVLFPGLLILIQM